MQRCIGVIYGGQVSPKFGSLCDTRPSYMLPFGGRYRLLDITLSNMANNDFSNVILYGEQHLRSTLDHVGNGKPWELNRRKNGLVLLPPAYDRNNKISEVETYYNSIKFYENSKEEYLFFANPMVIYKEDLGPAFDEFLKNDYDVLMFYKKFNDKTGDYMNSNKITFDENGKVQNVGINLGTEDEFNLFPKIGLMKKDVFIRLIKDSIERGNSETLISVVMKNIDKLNVGTYEMKPRVQIINGLKTYYDANMRLLDREVYNDVFFNEGVILTKSKDEPSALYRENAKVANSLIANGCIIEGQVENSIIFRGVIVKKNAIVKNSILFQKTVVGEDAVVINVIADKYAEISDGVSIVGSKANPYVIPKNEIVER